MRKLIASSSTILMMLALVGCSEDDNPGRQRGSWNPRNQVQRQQTQRTIQNDRARAGSMRTNNETMRTQIQRRLNMGTFDPSTLPEVSPVKVVKASFARDVEMNGKTYNLATLCLQSDGKIENGSDLLITQAGCPESGELVGASEIALKASMLDTGRTNVQNTNQVIEIMHNDTAIGLILATPTFAKQANGTFFPNGEKRYELLALCTTSVAIAQQGIPAKDYGKACEEAGI